MILFPPSMREVSPCAMAHMQRRKKGQDLVMSRRIAGSDALQVRFWGVRGSTCASGPQFVEFGGHTPCVKIRCGQRLFVVDAGTGISAFGQEIGAAAPAEIDILLSHLHLDHIGGMPFFKPVVLGSERVRAHLLRQSRTERAPRRPSTASSRRRSSRSRSITSPARFEHHGFKARRDPDLRRRHERSRRIPLNHPGGATGYRFEHGGRKVCYVSDIEHSSPWPDPALADFVARRGPDDL